MAEHAHAHDAHGSERQLRLALALTAIILVVELVGGWLAHSLALFADAGHVLTDLAALGLTLFAARQAHRPADQARTYGYHRTGILVALLNAGALIVIAVLIGVEAYDRLLHPPAVQPLPMVAAATVGLAINVFVATRLHGHGDLNMRSAWLHVVGDAGAAAGVVRPQSGRREPPLSLHQATQRVVRGFPRAVGAHETRGGTEPRAIV